MLDIDLIATTRVMKNFALRIFLFKMQMNVKIKYR